MPVATRTAFATRVLASLRRGWLIASRRAALRTRLRAEGVRAPVQPRGFVANVRTSLERGGLARGRTGRASAARRQMVAGRPPADGPAARGRRPAGSDHDPATLRPRDHPTGAA